MKLNWLATTAVALVIGSGAVFAQTQSEHKRGEGPQAQTPAAKDHKKEQQGQAASALDRKQAQESKQSKDVKQPIQQSQDTHQKREPSTTGSEQSQEHKKDRDTKQANEPKKKQDNQAWDTKQPELKTQARDTKQPDQKNQAHDTKQPGQKKQARDTTQKPDKQQAPSSNQAAQPSTAPNQPSTSTAQKPSTSPNQQAAQPGSTTRQGQTTGQATDQNRSSTSTSVNASDPQRTQISERLTRDRAAFKNQNINISVSVGERLPSRVRIRPLPTDIVRIEPRYRGYDYTIVQDEVYIVEPRTKKVVDIIREPGSMQSQTMFRSERINLTAEQRETLKQSAKRMTSTAVSATPSSSSVSGSSCLTLQPVPEELTRANPELSQYQMLAIGDQVVLVDPREQKVVDVVQ